MMLLIVVLSCLSITAQASVRCKDQDCGWNSRCSSNGTCQCAAGFSFAPNKYDCSDDRCKDKYCLECADLTSCHRCMAFIEQRTGQCLEACSVPYDLVVDGHQVGKVCPEGMGELDRTYLAMIIGACGGLLLTAMLCLIVYSRYRLYSDRKSRLKFMAKMMEKQKQERRKLSELQKIGLNSGDQGTNLDYVPDCTMYMRQLASLRPHKDTFVQMLREAKGRLVRLSHDDKKIFVYRSIVHQLGRVLVLLLDDHVTMPMDGNGLLHWADKVLHQYRKQQTDSCQPHTPPSTHSTMRMSTFKPEQRIVSDHDTLTYQTMPPLLTSSVDSIQQDCEVSEINIVQLLEDSCIQPIEV